MKKLVRRTVSFSFFFSVFFTSSSIIPVYFTRAGGAYSNEQLAQIRYPQTISEVTETEQAYLADEPEARAIILDMPASRYIRLTGTNLPDGLEQLKKIKAEACEGQYESFSFLIHAREDLKEIKISWDDFRAERQSIRASAMEAFVAKVWYQAGVKSTEVKNKLLTQELLLKNDDLVWTDPKSQTNYLWVTDRNGKGRYTDISSPKASFPANVNVMDAQHLQPFPVNRHSNKLVWLTLHVPERSRPGIYKSRISITDRKGLLKQIPIEINVLPFILDESRIIYSLYYHGALRNWALRPFHSEDKSPEQLEIELRDMKEHGVLYPNNYQDIRRLPENLAIREKVGLPKDILFSTLLDWFSDLPRSDEDIDQFSSRVEEYKKIAEQFGYRQVYIYGIDEARGEKLKAQRPAWTAARSKGVKIFVAGYYDTFNDMGDILDAAVIQGPLKPDLAAKYHAKGNKIFSYSNPQVGQENPEVYRRNFGFALWKAGYDGAMNYAYQKNYNSIWNDFDHPRYREEVFAYPQTRGVISTVQWEGFRQGINDVRFISTLLNKIDKMKKSGKDVKSLERWVSLLDVSGDPAEVRKQVIEKIMSVNYQ